MGRQKNPSEFLTTLRKDVDSLSGIDRDLVDPLLIEADALRMFVEDLRQKVSKQGTMIEKEVRDRIEMVENPALTAYSKNVGRLGDLMKKISGFAKTATSDDEEVDELDEFIRR